MLSPSLGNISALAVNGGHLMAQCWAQVLMVEYMPSVGSQLPDKPQHLLASHCELPIWPIEMERCWVGA